MGQVLPLQLVARRSPLYPHRYWTFERWYIPFAYPTAYYRTLARRSPGKASSNPRRSGSQSQCEQSSRCSQRSGRKSCFNWTLRWIECSWRGRPRTGMGWGGRPEVGMICTRTTISAGEFPAMSRGDGLRMTRNWVRTILYFGLSAGMLPRSRARYSRSLLCTWTSSRRTRIRSERPV